MRITDLVLAVQRERFTRVRCWEPAQNEVDLYYNHKQSLSKGLGITGATADRLCIYGAEEDEAVRDGVDEDVSDQRGARTGRSADAFIRGED